MLLSPIQATDSSVIVVGLTSFVLAIATISESVVVVKATEKRVKTEFGEFDKVLEPGINVVKPFVSNTHAFDMQTHAIDVPRQEATTRDEFPVSVDIAVHVDVMDVEKAFLADEAYQTAVSRLTQTTLRTVLGDMDLDDALNGRQEISSRLLAELDIPTDEWGIHAESVEVRDVNSPESCPPEKTEQIV
jgi:regulator of protease activity HflC (stomatin/prohibitin superfamily)